MLLSDDNDANKWPLALTSPSTCIFNEEVNLTPASINQSLSPLEPPPTSSNTTLDLLFEYALESSTLITISPNVNSLALGILPTPYINLLFGI